MPIAKEILAKYENKFPIFTNQTALNYLTRIGKKAGITRLHTVVEHRGDEVTTKQVPVYKLIKTHTARRSFICNMLLRGYDAHLIMKITGHNDVESFQKYVKLTSGDAAKLMLETEAKKAVQTKVKQSNDIVTSSNENIAEAISKGIEAGLKHKNDIAYDLLFNSQESNIESYGIDRDVDISQFDLNKNEIDFLNRSMDNFEVGTPSLKVRKILNRLLELGIVVRLK